MENPIEKKSSSSRYSSWAFGVDSIQNWASWDKAFSPEECLKIIEIGESKILGFASVASRNNNVGIVQLSQRYSTIAWLYPSDNMKWVYRRVTDVITSLNNQYFKFDLFGLTEARRPFQFTKYEAPGGFFGMHKDMLAGYPIRKLSMTLQLSDPEDYEGGELVLLLGKEAEILSKEQGKMICFPSYLLHEVRPVTKGTRYSLVAWVTGKAFK